MFFHLELDPKEEATAEFVGELHRQFQEAFAEARQEEGLTVAEVARRLGVNRSVVWRRLKGLNHMTEVSMAELAWAMGRCLRVEINKAEQAVEQGDNYFLLDKEKFVDASSLDISAEERALSSSDGRIVIPDGSFLTLSST